MLLANIGGMIEAIMIALRRSSSPSHVAARRGPLPLPAGEEKLESL